MKSKTVLGAASGVALLLAASAAWAEPASARPVDGKWEVDKRYRYEFVEAGKPAGREVFWFTEDEDGVVQLHEDLDVSSQGVSLKGKSLLTFDDAGMPAACKKNFEVTVAGNDAQSGAFDMEYLFADEQVTVRIRRNNQPYWAGTVAVPERLHAFDNNMIGALAYIVGKAAPEPGRDYPLFHMGTTRVLKLALSGAEKTVARIGGRGHPVVQSKFTLDGVGGDPLGTLAVSPEGRLLEYTQPAQKVVIRLVNP